MKRLIKVFVLLCFIPILVGCKDASAQLKDANTTLITVGNTNITKGQLYQTMRSLSGETTAVNKAIEIIAEKEVEANEDLETEAKEYLKSMDEMFGGSYLSLIGMEEEEFLNDYILKLKEDELVKKYISESYNVLVSTYSPVRATVLSFTTEEDANGALSALKDGSMTPTEVVKEFDSTSTGNPELITINTTSYDAEATALVRSNSKDDGWAKVANAAGDRFYVIRVEENDAEALREEFSESMLNNSTIREQSTAHYLSKYQFHIYDIDILNDLKTNNPTYVIQQ